MAKMAKTKTVMAKTKMICRTLDDEWFVAGVFIGKCMCCKKEVYDITPYRGCVGSALGVIHEKCVDFWLLGETPDG